MSKITLSGNASGTGTFTLAAPNSNSDRTLNLPDNSGTVVTTGSTAAITQSMLETLVVPLGVGQTWQNVAGSRASGTTYTNSTGRPIFVSVNITIWLASAVVNGVTVALTGTSNVTNASFVVPSGGTYSVTVGGGTINAWAELR